MENNCIRVWSKNRVLFSIFCVFRFARLHWMRAINQKEKKLLKMIIYESRCKQCQCAEIPLVAFDDGLFHRFGKCVGKSCPRACQPLYRWVHRLCRSFSSNSTNIKTNWKFIPIALTAFRFPRLLTFDDFELEVIYCRSTSIRTELTTVFRFHLWKSIWTFFVTLWLSLCRWQKFSI